MKNHRQSSYKKLFQNQKKFFTVEDVKRTQSSQATQRSNSKGSRRDLDLLETPARKSSFFAKFSEEYGFSAISSPAYVKN